MTSSDNAQVGQEVVCPGDEPVVGGGATTNSTLGQRVEINTSRAPTTTTPTGASTTAGSHTSDNINSGDVIAARP